MKRWKALVLLGTLCLGLLLPWQAAAQEEPAGQLAEESGAAGVTEQLDWDVQSVLEQLGLSVTAPDETGEKFTLSHIWQVFSDYLSGRISQPFAMLGGLLTVILFAALLQGIRNAVPWDRYTSLSVRLRQWQCWQSRCVRALRRWRAHCPRAHRL